MKKNIFIIFAVLLLVIKFAHTQEFFTKAVVATDDFDCSKMGRDILKKNGSAVDAAITSTLCMGVAYPHAMGIGGGMIMTVYDQQTKKSITFDGREVAPGSATSTMFSSLDQARFGPKSIAVPGELRGLERAHKMFGKLKWSELVKPVVTFARRGHRVSRHMAVALQLQKDKYDLKRQPGMSIFINPRTDSVYKEGDIIKRPDLAKTLQKVASNGVQTFYSGFVAKKIIQDIRSRGSNLTLADLNGYQSQQSKALSTKLSTGHTIYTSNAPTGGPLLIYVMNILDNYRFKPTNDRGDTNRELTYHRIIEAYKFAYGQRTKMGDAKYEQHVLGLVRNLTRKAFAKKAFSSIDDIKTYNNPKHYGAETTQTNDHGTGHVSVLSANGQAVSVTSTINSYFGSGIMSQSTGVILNNQMDDFSFPNLPSNSAGFPPSPPNYIKPKKRPISTACPTIVVSRNGTPVMVTGAAGGTKIVTTVAMTLIRKFYFNQSLKEVMETKRFYHQLIPNSIGYENPFDGSLMKNLKKKGHVFHRYYGTFSVVNVVGSQGEKKFGMCDPRRQGTPAGY